MSRCSLAQCWEAGGVGMDVACPVAITAISTATLNFSPSSGVGEVEARDGWRTVDCVCNPTEQGCALGVCTCVRVCVCVCIIHQNRAEPQRTPTYRKAPQQPCGAGFQVPMAWLLQTQPEPAEGEAPGWALLVFPGAWPQLQ